MKLEELRQELKEDLANAQLCPRCKSYGRPTGDPGQHASRCHACDIIFGWGRESIWLEPPENRIELGDVITAADESNKVFTGQVIEIETGRNVIPHTDPSGKIDFVDRGPLNVRAKISFWSKTAYGAVVLYEVRVQLRGAFIREKSASGPPHDI